MRIAYVRSSVLAGSGLVNHIIEIAKRIKRAGNEIIIVCRECETKPPTGPIYELKYRGSNVPFLRNLIFPFRSLSVLERFDIVHTEYHPGIWAGNAASRLVKKPHVFTYHGFAPVRAWRNYKQTIKMVDHRIETFLALRSNVNKIITVSNFLKQELIRRYFLNGDMVEVIYNGVDARRFNPNVSGQDVRDSLNLGNRPIVLYFGRLAPYKGVQFLIQAIPRVLRDLPEAKFLIAGAGRYDVADIGRLIRQLNVESSVIFTGYIPDQDVPKFYACCDIFCYPSLWEGFGLTPAEAQACGKPVVAFNTCALPEVVKDKSTGLLVEPRNVEALGEGVVSLLQNKEKSLRMGREGRSRVLKLFSWDKAASQTLKVYREVLS
jgi:glycosyltransferase involved in cell wall biosynthesis